MPHDFGLVMTRLESSLYPWRWELDHSSVTMKGGSTGVWQELKTYLIHGICLTIGPVSLLWRFEYRKLTEWKPKLLLPYRKGIMQKPKWKRCMSAACLFIWTKAEDLSGSLLNIFPHSKIHHSISYSPSATCECQKNERTEWKSKEKRKRKGTNKKLKGRR